MNDWDTQDHEKGWGLYLELAFVSIVVLLGVMSAAYQFVAS